ncbi:recombination-associated protein RdgC [Schlegelella sp. S2-27]|uniref:Recombination-associated protein RdgC n=1 Tax=Caldimonas mangrovi TaxID=2944811 RepID=A0ABT0YIH5_9BURK|nr:recombination-associated protein RdgC [Caldimonas mangrovi]MCM5678505.1 recombination-associated protein RdgC [Caldimonas mangrovi]
MFKNALVFRIAQWDRPAVADIEERLAGARFAECGATQPESAGWVEPRGQKHGALVESIGGQWILRLCTETKSVPASAVKTRLEEQLDKVEQETGRRPKGKRAKELKEEIVRDLLPRAFPKRGNTTVWINPAAGFVVVDASSIKKADAIVSRLVELLGGGLSLSFLQSEISPAVAMSGWLKSKEAPAGFTIDRDCELKQPDSEKATVRYARHTLDIDEVGQHIEQGKVPTQVAMTWDSRVSFVLTESLAIKKIKLLDVVLEGASSATRDDGGFDADVALMTGELGKLIPDLIDALGGELDREKFYKSAGSAVPADAGGPAAEDNTPPWELPAAA